MEVGNYKDSFTAFVDIRSVSVNIARDDSEVNSLCSKFNRYEYSCSKLFFLKKTDELNTFLVW